MWNWDEMLAIAYMIGIKPVEFWEMTWREFYCCWEGYKRRDGHEWEKVAFDVAHNLNLWAKRRITPAELLGREEPQPVISSAEEFHAEAQRRLRLAAERKAENVRRRSQG